MRYLITFAVTSLLAGACFFIVGLSLTPAPIRAEYWVRELLVVKRSIARKHAGQRKVIVASGSGTMFSVDTTQLSREFGIPVINQDLQASLPLETILSEAKAAAERGDVVVLPLETSYYGTLGLTGWQARNMIAWQRDRWESMTRREQAGGLSLLGPTIFFELVDARLRERFFRQTIRERLAAFDDAAIISKAGTSGPTSTFAYSAYNLDALGNMRNTDGTYYFGNPPSPASQMFLSPDAGRLLREFVATMSATNVEVFFAHTPHLKTVHSENEVARRHATEFSAQLVRIAPVLDEWKQLGFEREFFFNTESHLNSQGRMLRTAMLAESLKANPRFVSQLRAPR